MATSKLQAEVRAIIIKLLQYIPFEENAYPAWLQEHSGRRLELDFFIQVLGLAVEVQGRQHDQYIKHFHETPLDF